jgi:hypothetical protein
MQIASNGYSRESVNTTTKGMKEDKSGQCGFGVLPQRHKNTKKMENVAFLFCLAENFGVEDVFVSAG